MRPKVDLMLVREAVASTALENGWDAEEQQRVFNETVFKLIAEDMPNQNHKKRGY